MIHEIKRRLAQDWKSEWWLVVPFLIFPVHMVSVFLTAGGHAPFAAYVPILVVDGPVFLLGSVLGLDNHNRWGDYIPILFGYTAPSFLYLMYAAILRLSTPARRWTILKILIFIHLFFSVITVYLMSRVP
jgi:hypothetical protein